MFFVSQVFAAAATATDSFQVFLTVNAEVAPPSGGGGVGTNFPLITDIVVTPNKNSAIVSYKTTIPTTAILSYGKTQSLGGSVLDTNISATHTATISNLSANTLYYFSIEATSLTGAKGYSGLKNFSTLPLAPVVNVVSFTATARTNDIKLDWKMPTGQENDPVRVVRSENFYPTNVNDGTTIFEGAENTSFIDTNVKQGVRYYYTLFVKGADGIYSSGAVADARIPLPGEAPETQKSLFERLAKAPFVDEKIASLTLTDFIFSQPGREDFKTSGNETLFIEGDKTLTVKLSYERVPELLKTIAFTLSDPDDLNKKFSFLLRANDEKTFYTATIAPLGRSGEYNMDIAIVDYKNQGLKQISGSLLAVVSRAFKGEGIFAPPAGFTVNDLMIALLVVLAMVALSFVSAKRIDLGYFARAWSRYRPRRRMRV